MRFGENEQLFGFDPLEGIVAVEPAAPNAVDLFIRTDDGRTEVRREEFRAFHWSTLPLDTSEELAGNLPYRFLNWFDTWDDYLASRAAFQKDGAPTFSFNDPVQQYLTVSGRTLFKGLPWEKVRRLQIDIETAVSEGFEFSSPDRDSLLAIALGDSDGWEEVFTVEAGDEKAALEWLNARIAERDPDVIEGHHLFKVDLPYLVTRAKKLKVKLPWGRGGGLLRGRSSRLQIAEKTIQYQKFTVHGRHLVDTWVLAQYYDVSSRELENFDRETVARHFGLAVAEASAPVKALRNLAEVRNLANVLSRSYFIQAQIFPYNYQDVIVRGNATRINALFLREYLRRRHSLPEMPEPRHFEGGYTDIFRTGIIENVHQCDVASLYPSVMLTFDLLPKADQLGIFRGLLLDLRTFRLEAKQAMREASTPAERSGLDALQSTFKILINSFYGYLGFAQGHFADFDAAEQVTAKGREILRQMVDWLSSHGAEVIEIDTDGIYFHPPEGVDPAALQQGLSAELPAGIEVEFEKRYRSMFSYKAKNYALLDEDGVLTFKGAALKSRGMEPYLRDYLQEFVRLLLVGEKAEAAFLRQKIADWLRRREFPIGEIAKTEALQDSLASYQKKISASSRNRSAAFELALKSGRDYQAGDQVSYYVTGTKKKVVAYENSRLVAEWNPEDRDENVEYYVAKLEDTAKKFAEFVSDVQEPSLF